MKNTLLLAGLALAVLLVDGSLARSQFVATGGYNPYTGRAYGAQAAVNPFTGRVSASSGYVNPYTGAAGRAVGT